MSWRTPKIQEKFTVVEVEKAQAPPENSDAIAAVESLRGHPGFQWLLQKLRYQGARLDAELKGQKHETLREVDFLQSGIHWCHWLQGQLDFAHERWLASRDATPSENKLFEQISSQIELIGVTSPNP